MKNVSIIMKFLLIMGFFGLFSVASTLYSTGQMRQIGSQYRQLLDGDSTAALAMARANRNLQTARASIAELLLATSVADNQAAEDGLKNATADFASFMDKAASADPADAPKIQDLKSRGLQVFSDSCRHTVQLGVAATTEAQNLLAQQAYFSECQPAIPPLANDVIAEVNQLQNAATADEGRLSSQTDGTILLTFAIILAGLTAVMIGGFFAMQAWLVDPVKALQSVMGRISGGDYQTKIIGLDRKDEIGGMAKAVQVFKEAGLEKIRLESEAAQARAQAEDARKRGEAEREAAAKQQALVVTSLATGLEKLSSGDLLFRINTSFSAEYEKLRTDFNGAMEKLQETMKSIAANTQGVRTGAAEINQASDDLSRRTEQQAASLEQTAAALDEITATVKRAAEGAKEARDLASTAKSDAERSGGVVREMVDAMNGIETSSKQIGNIIGVIDEIAFQTNLLALNAGVEAARAGDAGRGFAVVATEVRALAQRSAEAAKEIKGLISTSGQQVESGVKLVGETGKALTRIVAQVSKLNDVVSEIAQSAQEQATGLNEVNTAVNQMDQVTQRNAAMVEQSTAASHSLAGEAQELAQLVGQFQIGQIAEARTHARKPAAAPKPAEQSSVPGGGHVEKMKAMSRKIAGGGGVAESSKDWSEF